MRNIQNSKKGNALIETITIVVMITVFIFGSIIAYNALKDVNSDIQIDSDMPTIAKQTTQSATDNMPNIIEGLVLFILVGLTLSAIIFAFIIDTHPIFFVVTIILLIIVMFIGAFLSNAFTDVLDAEYNTQSSFPISYWVMNNLLNIALIIGFLIIISLYAKSRTG